MITDAAIRSALANAPKSGKSNIELKDGERRGQGRLALIIRVGQPKPPSKTAPVSADWYAVWYRGDRRKMAKIGSYPIMALTEARKHFRADFLPAIARGDEPQGAFARRVKVDGRTVLDLFTAYADNLDAQGKFSGAARAYLLGCDNAPPQRWKGRKTQSAADAIGSGRLACEVTHKDIKPHLANIHKRGAVSAAAHARSYISAAFTFGMKSANAYHQAAGDVDWGIVINPVAAIPVDPASKSVGTRHLTPAEFRDFWNWLVLADERGSASRPLRLCMATGQRLTEILCITPSPTHAAAFAERGVRLGVYDASMGVVDWGKTKAAKGGNMRPHCLPLSSQAIAILDGCTVLRGGLYFPQRASADKVLSIRAAESLVTDYLKKHPAVPHFCPRDIRRTWKTLSGAAGISKEMRDRLQNHARSDVSSRHYDRYDYLAEKRAAVKVWSKYMDRIIAGELDTPVAALAAGGVAN